MDKNLEKIIKQISDEQGFSHQQIRAAVNHMFNWQRQALADKTHVAYNLQGFGKITHLNDRGVNSVEADEYIAKKRKKIISATDFEEKDKLIQEIKEYNYRTFIATKYQKLLIKHDKGSGYLGFSYKLLMKKSVDELKELINFLKEHNKPVKKNVKTNSTNKNSEA